MTKFKFLFFLLAVSLFSLAQDDVARKINETLFYISHGYVDEVDYDDLNEVAVKAVLEKLDPHSIYISAKDVESANERINGSFVGVGIRFQILRDTLIVVNCIPNGPAEKVGLLAGDKIVKVEEEIIAGIGLKNSDVRDKLLGEKGSKVNVDVIRGRTSTPISFTITRDKIPVHSVASSYMVDDKVGYIKLTSFSKTTEDEVREAIKSLKKEGMKDLIFDLQGNGGGLLHAAKIVSDEFLDDKKLIVYSEGRKQPKSSLIADKKGAFEKGRLVILIDESSASASEIVAGAIQDWDRGLIVGRRSFGKGLVQRPINLYDGAQIRLTIARYYTPSGRYIQKPYDDLEAFKNDYYNRYKNGEFMHRDSIHFDDSLKYETLIKKRTVYGGGGIMPDEFVGIDTTEYSDYFSKLSRSGTINNFAIDYVNESRENIKANYPSLNDFVKDFDVTEDLLQSMVDFAVEKDTALVFNPEEFEISKDLIKYRLKAMIGQNIWDQTAFYQIINNKNEVFLRAYEILKNDEYDALNLTQK